MSIPKINIKHSRLLQRAFSFYLSQIPGEREKWAEKSPTTEECKKKAEERKTFWEKDADIILNAIQDVTGLTFARDIIDAYLVYGYASAFSDPIVITFKANETRFVDILAHELIHVILTDNKEQSYSTIAWLKERFPNIVGDTTIIHILIHAIHKDIYLNYLKSPERLAADIADARIDGSYARAWEIVEEVGYKEIIELFKKVHNLK